jgi:hypothetical protein
LANPLTTEKILTSILDEQVEIATESGIADEFQALEKACARVLSATDDKALASGN